PRGSPPAPARSPSGRAGAADPVPAVFSGSTPPPRASQTLLGTPATRARVAGRRTGALGRPPAAGIGPRRRTVRRAIRRRPCTRGTAADGRTAGRALPTIPDLRRLPPPRG